MKKYKVIERWNKNAKRMEFRVYKRLPFATKIKNVGMFVIGAIVFISVSPVFLFLFSFSFFNDFPSIKELIESLFWLEEDDIFYTLEDATERIIEIENQTKETTYWY